MLIKYLSIFTVIVLAVLSGLPALGGIGVTNDANARYAADTQTQASTNECNTGTNCAINSPQTQGDGSASSPTNLQISRSGGEQDEAPGSNIPVFFDRLLVQKKVICPTGFVCPTPDKFTMRVQASGSGLLNVNPQTFQGSDQGTLVKIAKIGPDFIVTYEVTETAPPSPAGLVLIQSPSRECADSFFRADESKTCTFTNEYRVAPTS